MKIFATADQHFFHKNILLYESEYRPWDNLDDMHNFMISQWNEIVSIHDFVIHLGDFGFGSVEKLSAISKKLNGTKILIKGNHDKSRSDKKWEEIGFKAVYKKPLCCNGFILSHKPVENVTDGFINIHGHVHSKPTGLDYSRYFNVSVEMHNFQPVELPNHIFGCDEIRNNK